MAHKGLLMWCVLTPWTPAVNTQASAYSRLADDSAMPGYEGFHGADAEPSLLWAGVMRVRSISVDRVSLAPHSCALCWTRTAPPQGQRKVGLTPPRGIREIIISKYVFFSLQSTQQWHSLAMHQTRAEALQVVREGHVCKKLTSIPGGEGVKS